MTCIDRVRKFSLLISSLAFTAFLIALLPTPANAQQPVTLPTPTPRATPNPTGTPAPAVNVPLPENVANGVVRVVTTGEYRRLFDSEGSRGFGTGSGFVIDANGLIVTNAHVVNGGDAFEIYFSGSDTSQPATLVAADECADIALLLLDPTLAPLNALAWRDHAATTGESVIAAGYPGGVHEIQATQGIVRNTGLRSFTDWASVANAIDHTAAVEPGNSGGPLLDTAGNVVGIVYARGSAAGDAAAIAGEDAQAIIEALLSGNESFRTGMTVQAFAAGGDQFGIWITSVAPDSPADRAGLQPGDILRRFNNRVVGRDGTLARYCQILRNLPLDAQVATEIYRPDTAEALSGTLNGAPLQPFRTLEAAAHPTATPAPTPVAAPLTSVSDTSGTVMLNAPSDWIYEVNGAVGFGSIISARIFGVAPSERDYESGRALLRVVVGEITGLDGGEILDDTRDDLQCTTFERSEYIDAAWQGIVDRCTGLHDPSYLNAFLISVEHPALFANLNFFVSQSHYPIELREVIAPLAENLVPTLPVADRPVGIVQVDALNVREGPGLEFAPITQVYGGEALPIAGKDNDACGWLFVAYSNLAGWVAAAPQYVSLDRPCAELAILTDAEIANWQAGVE